MSDLQPRGSSGLDRRSRADRAYKLVLATSGLTIVSIVLFVLAVFGVGVAGYAVVAAVLAAASGFMLRRTLNK